MRTTPQAIKIIIEDFLIRLRENKATLQDFETIFDIAEDSDVIIPPAVREFLLNLREKMQGGNDDTNML